ncbi:hypothetical protein D5F01_LYC01604 [Larimichthys crocea]|uniref:Uncharacterized protein n=1 Tax=Larimichthys crocea TaxID=215358 RepID=A0A6G0J6P5_LARCR|nr:hypothetical protein D5F01_LYC01604 [Larimichthys crocea]
MDRLPYTYLLIFYCLTFACIFGRGQDSSPSCEVQVMVQRGTIEKAAPKQHLHQGIEYSDYYAELHRGSKNSDGKLDLSWLPYFYICISAVLLVATFSVLTLLRFYGWRRILSFNHNKGKETSTHMIPDLPKDSNHSTLFLQSPFPHLKDVPSPTTVGPSQPPMMTSRNQPAVTVGETQAPERAVYSLINHRKSGLPAGEQPAGTKQNKRAEYAVINFP